MIFTLKDALTACNEFTKMLYEINSLTMPTTLTAVYSFQQFPLLVLSPQMSASRNEFWVVWPSILL